MTMTLHWGSGSPYAWTVLLALELKGMPYESRLLNLMAGEHKSPEFLAMNPRGKVPVLMHDGHAISESLAILAYLEAVQPEPPLFGATPIEKAAIMAAVSALMAYLEAPGIAIPYSTFFLPWGEESQAAIAAAARKVLPEMQRIDALLTTQDYLAGNTLTVADIRLYPMLQIIWRSQRVQDKQGGVADMKARERGHFPAIDRRRQRIEALPVYDKTYPPHWRKG